ncbi:glutamate receptor 1.4 [Hibiscus trionum]|nr:glutamate receptor 1.4 [Hibiscus trionum]
MICSVSFIDMSWCEGEVNDVVLDEEVRVGVIVDMGTWQGKVIQHSISMAIFDFCVQKSCRVRVVPHFRDSQGDPFQALSAALNLWEDAKVKAIFGAQTSTEAKFLTEFGDRNKIPVISFSKPSSFSFPTRSPFFVQIGDDQTSQIKGIAAFIELQKWRNVILIHQEYDFAMDDGMLSAMAAFFEEKYIHISFVAAIAALSEDDQIIEQLDELNTFQTGIFIVHLPHSLALRLFMNAKRLGMMSIGYAWIVTSKTMDHFDSTDPLSSSIDPSMQGVIGFQSYIPTLSSELQNVTSRLRRKFDVGDQPPAVDFRLGLLAYDAAWSLAKAVERLTETPQFTNELDAYRTSIRRSMLLREIFRSNFKGFSGEFRFINGKLISKAFEIVNVVHNGAKRVGFCTSTGEITMRTYEPNRRRRRLSDDIIDNLEPIIWPGGSLTVPKGRQARMLQTSGGKILRIGVPVRVGFRQLLEVKRDPFTNSTTVTGFCIEVFKAALEGLKYQVQYEFIPFMDANGNSAGTYTDLIHQVYLKKFDAVVGDATITSGRSLFVDFTISFTDIGVGIVAPAENKDMWIFYKVLTPTLWLAIVGYYTLRSFFIWMIERQTPRHVPDGFPPQPSSLSSILAGSWEQLRNKWSIFIAAVSLFMLFILSSSYTATLASVMTVQHIELHSKRSYIGYLGGSNITQGVLINNMNFENDSLKPLQTAGEYADALSKGSRKGGVSAILDEMPYIKIFLAEHPGDYSLIKSMPITNGFAFVFPKGSPLVTDLSREIAKLRESGKLELLENAWFRSQTSLMTSKDNDNVGPLTPESFGGLFLTTTGLSVGAFLMFQLPLLYHYYFHVVKNWWIEFVSIVRRRIGSLMKIFQRRKMVQSAAIHPQVQII